MNPETILTRYAADIAFVTEEQRATTLPDLVEQLGTAGERLDRAGINGAEDLDTAATYLADASSSTDDNERTVLLNRAANLLAPATDMVDEYRLMV